MDHFFHRHDVYRNETCPPLAQNIATIIPLHLHSISPCELLPQLQVMVEASGDSDQNRSPFDSTFDELVAQAFNSWNFPGLSIAVVDGTQDFAKVHTTISD